MATPTAASPAYEVAGSASDHSTQASSQTIPDSNLDFTIDETELASTRDYICVQKCGVVIGYPTLLVWACPSANQSELAYQLEDGSPIPESEVAWNFDFAMPAHRQHALERMLESDIKNLSPASPTSFDIHKTNVRPSPESTLAFKASEFRVTSDQLEQRSFDLQPREDPSDDDELVCLKASELFWDKYGEAVSSEDVHDALWILESSDVSERRVVGSPYMIWNTDDFVMGFKDYCKLLIEQNLCVSPDPADFITAMELDQRAEHGVTPTQAHSSKVLTPELLGWHFFGSVLVG